MIVASIATVCLSGALDEKLEAIAQAGFTGVEIFENDLLSYEGSPEDVRRMAESLGLRIVTYQPFRDFEGMPDNLRARAFARAEQKFDVAQALGCDLLMLCSNVSPASLGGIDRAAADLRELGERAARRGLRIGFEALAWGRHIHDYRDAWEVVRRANHPAVGLVLDSFHVLARGTEIESMRSIPGDRIFLVQLADAPRLSMDYLSWSRHFRCFPGQGDLPVADFMHALRDTGYDGLLSLEIFNDDFRAGGAKRIAADGRRSLIQLASDTGFGLDGSSATISMPPRAICERVEFVEFALDASSAARFEALLSGLGFAKTGVHRSKPVTRWSQGAANIIVNMDREGFAKSFRNVHGASVCAICLRVDDAAGAVARAAALLNQPFTQPTSPDELVIPAVPGLGNSLIYFVDGRTRLDRWWEIDFGSVPAGRDAADAGVTGIDHLAQVSFFDEVLTWILFYTSLLDVAKAPTQDVIDPGGLIKSQALQSNDGRVRFVLNGSQSGRTTSARFLSEFFGAGVQHIALATSDILAVARRLRANNVATLSIPANYYADLEARFGLSRARCAELQEFGILYDRDEQGDFLQLYTAAFDERFFFEIVQRDGYRGFGAANAGVRLAAQARLAAMAAAVKDDLA